MFDACRRYLVNTSLGTASAAQNRKAFCLNCSASCCAAWNVAPMTSTLGSGGQSPVGAAPSPSIPEKPRAASSNSSACWAMVFSCCDACLLYGL
jgi:hypothetical protein